MSVEEDPAAVPEKHKAAVEWLRDFIKGGDGGEAWGHAAELKSLLEEVSQQGLMQAERIENLEEALFQIEMWCDAYPEDIFTPLNDERVKWAGDVLKANDIEIGALHAQWARHLLSGVSEIAKRGLKVSEHEQGEVT